MNPSNKGSSLNLTVNDFTTLSSFFHVAHYTNDNGYENNSTGDDSTKCGRIVTNSLQLASSFVAVVARTLVVAGASTPVVLPCTNSALANLSIAFAL
jgi:hypothetical protein